MREQSVFALVLARADGKLGPKMTPSTADCTPSGPNGRGRGTAASPAPGADPRCGFNFGAGKVLVGGQSPAAFAGALALFAGDATQYSQLVAEDYFVRSAELISLSFSMVSK